MFKIVANPTFSTPVRLSRPDAEKPVEIEITWKHMTLSEYRAWTLSANAPDVDDAAFLDKAIAGWSRVVDAHDRPLAYSREALAVLLNTFPSAGAEFVQAYRARLLEARSKN